MVFWDQKPLVGTPEQTFFRNLKALDALVSHDWFHSNWIKLNSKDLLRGFEDKVPPSFHWSPRLVNHRLFWIVVCRRDLQSRPYFSGGHLRFIRGHLHIHSFDSEDAAQKLLATKKRQKGFKIALGRQDR